MGLGWVEMATAEVGDGDGGDGSDLKIGSVAVW